MSDVKLDGKNIDEAAVTFDIDDTGDENPNSADLRVELAAARQQREKDLKNLGLSADDLKEKNELEKEIENAKKTILELEKKLKEISEFHTEKDSKINEFIKEYEAATDEETANSIIDKIRDLNAEKIDLEKEKKYQEAAKQSVEEKKDEAVAKKIMLNYLTEKERKEIFGHFKNQKLFAQILAKKGLELDKNPKDLSKEERKEVEDLINEAFNEIATAKLNNREVPTLDLIQALYVNNENYYEGSSNVTDVTSDDLAVAKENANQLPEAIRNNVDNQKNVIEPAATSDDMQQVAADMKEQNDTINVYIHNGLVYMTEEDIEKLGYRSDSNPIKLDESEKEVISLPFFDAEDVLKLAESDASPFNFNIIRSEGIPVFSKNDEPSINVYVDNGTVYMTEEDALIRGYYNCSRPLIIDNLDKEVVKLPYTLEDVKRREAFNNTVFIDINDSKDLDGVISENENNNPNLEDTIVLDGTPMITAASDNNPNLEDTIVLDGTPIIPAASDNNPNLADTVVLDGSPVVDQATPEPVVTTNSEPVEPMSEPVDSDRVDRNLRYTEVIYKVTKDIGGLRVKDANRYNAINIKSWQNFKNELHSGQVDYNIVHFLGAVTRLVSSKVNKWISGILLTNRGRNAVKTINTRLNNLSEKELQTLYDQYVGNSVMQNVDFIPVNSLIMTRMSKWVMEKVENLNEEIRHCYDNLFVILGEKEALKEEIENTPISKSDDLREKYKELMHLGAENIKVIMAKRAAGDKLLGHQGLHGMEEVFKAAKTRMNYVGLRHSKRHDFDEELTKTLAQFGSQLESGLATGNDEDIVEGFLGEETCFADNTEIKKGIFGDKSVGKKYYLPLLKKLDYRDDPFLRDLFSTIAIASAGISAINAYKVHHVDVKNEQLRVDEHNAQIDQVMDVVHSDAKKQISFTKDYTEGMKAQANQDVLTVSNSLEREALDMSNWKFSDKYRALDSDNHDFYNGFYEDVNNQLSDIAIRNGRGIINNHETMDEIINVANGSQEVLADVADNCLEVLEPYAATHNFNLEGVQHALEYTVAHPDAITEMHNAIGQSVDISHELYDLSIDHYEALASLPSDMYTTLIAAASSAALANKVYQGMKSKGYSSNKEYDDSITKKMRSHKELDDNDDRDIDLSVNDNSDSNIDENANDNSDSNIDENANDNDDSDIDDMLSDEDIEAFIDRELGAVTDVDFDIESNETSHSMRH
ncbi:MAG: hypothetical protein IKE63_04550 [Bacilli bacterium]|nr:hypothetical protein [Bacilli bacterium]